MHRAALRALIAAFAAALPAASRERAEALIEVESDGRSAPVSIALSAPFEASHDGVETAILFVHGVERDAPQWLRDIDEGLRQRGIDGSVFVAVPQFLDEADIDPADLDDILTTRWTNHDWIDGATASRPTHILSYHVADAVLARLADPAGFPTLKRVTVTGFASAATLVQRLAMISEATDALETRGVAVRFLVGSADSFLYFGAERPRDDGSSAVPPAIECTTYNDWPYGPREAPQTLKEWDKPVRFFAERYAARDVVYLVGENETRPLGHEGCEMLSQGTSLAERLASYLHYLEANWPGVAHQVIVVPEEDGNPEMLLERPALFDLLLGAPPAEVRETLSTTRGDPI